MTNVTRQVAWRGLPRVGKPLVMDIYGPAPGAWLLGGSLASANASLPPYGPLNIELGLVIALDDGPFDATGLASAPFVVPAVPALVGLPLYWQALAGPPFATSNLETTVLTGQ